MPDAHARFAPSASGRWLNCPGSIPLSEQLLSDGKIPADTSGDAAKRGTAMHDASENHLLAGTDPRNYSDPIKYEGGTVSVEENSLCYDIPGLPLSRRFCGRIYRNPDGTPDKRNEYVLVDMFDVHHFSLKE